jgi:hypothetical protein
VARDMLSGPSTLSVFPLFERIVSFVNSFCRGLRFALAERSSSCLDWPQSRLWYLPDMTELAGSGVIVHYAEGSE